MIVNKMRILTFLAFVVLSACEKEIEIEIEEGVDELVFNAWFQVGEVPELEISKSVFIFDKNSTSMIRNAKVRLYQNNELYGELIYDPEKERYTNTELEVEEASQYEIIAEHPQYGVVKSKVQVPAKLNAEDVSLSYTNFVTEQNSYQNYSGEVRITIGDPAEGRNYYLIRVMSVEKSYNPDLSQDTIYRYNYRNTLHTNDNQIYVIYQYGGGDLLLLSDDIFNGNVYTVKLSSYNDLRSDEQFFDSSSYFKRYHQIQLYQVNEAFYRYYISLENNEYPEVFTEPVQVYSNVENGYGIVGASTKHTKDIEEHR